MPGMEGKMEVKRITNGQPASASGNWHNYSRRPAFSVDNKYYVLNDRVLTASDCSLVRRTPLSNENVASSTNPDLIYGLSGNRFIRYNISSGSQTTLYTAPSGGDVTFGNWEGQLSADDRRVVLAWGQNNNKTLSVLDIPSAQIVGQVQTGNYFSNYNSADISPLGNFFSVTKDDRSVAIFRADGSFVRTLALTSASVGNHNDWVLGENNAEILAGSTSDFGLYNATTNTVSQADVINNSTIRFATGHTSGVAFGRPGWVYHSNDVWASTPALFAFKVAGGQTQVEFWGWHYSHLGGFPNNQVPAYRAHAMISPSFDGSQIMFNSNWGNDNGPIYSIVARPVNAVTRTPLPVSPPAVSPSPSVPEENETNTAEVKVNPENPNLSRFWLRSSTPEDITENTATISFTLSKVGKAQLEYGASMEFGELGLKENSLTYSTHKQTLSDLEPGTVYYYRVIAESSAGQKLTSRTLSFKTAGVATSAPKNEIINFDGEVNVSSAWKEGKYAYVIKQDFGITSDSTSNSRISTLRIFEDGLELATAHTPHQTIRDFGEGRFSHWEKNLYFSASDNSDPRTNGKKYTFLRNSTAIIPPPANNAQKTASPSYDGEINVSSAWKEGRHGYVVKQDFGTLSDSSSNSSASTLRIFENGVEMGPAHSAHISVRFTGNGRFSHWGNNLYFSASDNSDPTTNGRKYTFLRNSATSTANNNQVVNLSPATPAQTTSSRPTPLPTPSSSENCSPFPRVQTRDTPVNANLFGAVPRINGRLPAEMPIGVPFDGPVPGTEYIRISSESGNGTHYYSTVQAWNADMTKVMIGNGVVDENRLLDATNNYSLLPMRVNLNSDRVWSNIDPDIVYGISGNALYKLNVSTGQREEIYRRPNGATIALRGKAAIPNDDSKLLLYVPDDNRLVSIDLASNRVPRPVLGELNFTPYGDLRSGGMFLNFDHSGKWATVRVPNSSQLYRLTPDLRDIRQLGDPMCCHSDHSYNAAGESVTSETLFGAAGSMRVYNYDTMTVTRTPSVVTSGSRHFPSYISGRGQQQCGRGWVILSGEETEGSPNHPLIAVKLDGNSNRPTFKALGGDLHSGRAVSNPSVNAGKQKAVQSPDGNAVMFDSDGGVPGGELSTYILRVKQ